VANKKDRARAAGWYDDAGRQRYWNGEEWTEHFADTYAADVRASSVPDRLRALWVGWNSRERWVALGSAAGTVIGILGLIVPLAVADRGASVDTIGVDSQLGGDDGLVAADMIEPVSSGLAASAAGLTADAEERATWAVPVDAPWAELFALHICEVDGNGYPTARGDADTAAAAAWIERHGVPTSSHDLWASISNTAGAGPITVSEVRPQGTLTPAPRRVWVSEGVCGGIGDCAQTINARIALGADPVAVFGDPPAYDYCEPGSMADIVAQPGDPVVFDVAPGEVRPFYLKWTQTEDFSGRFVATVTAGGQSSTIDLSPGNADIASLAVNEPATLLLAGYGEFIFGCDPDGNVEGGSPDNTVAYCTLDQWLAMIGKD
jgi:hypothetical protein